MIIPQLLSKIYTDDIYVVNEYRREEMVNADAPVKTNPKETAKSPAIPKAFDHVVLSDIEPNPSQKELLSKILEAVGLNIDKIKIIVGIEFPENIQAKNLVSFNVYSGQNSAAEKYKVLETISGKVLLADSLAVLDTDVSRKKALWQALKTMYPK
jgi:hypothetical protein